MCVYMQVSVYVCMYVCMCSVCIVVMYGCMPRFAFVCVRVAHVCVCLHACMWQQFNEDDDDDEKVVYICLCMYGFVYVCVCCMCVYCV